MNEMPTAKLWTSAFALLLSLFASDSQARLFNYEDIPIGTRGIGMGNTGVALGDDIGAIFLNPATMAFNDGSQVSASASAYSRIDTRTGEFVSLFRSAADNITRGGFLSIPANVGGFVDKGEWNIGGAVFVPSAFENQGSLDINENYVADFESSSSDIWINVFASKQISKKAAWGLGLFYVSRDFSEKFSYFDSGSGNLAITFEERQWGANGLVAVLGYTREANEKWRWGVSLRSPAWQWGGQGRIASQESGDEESDERDFATQGLPLPIRLSSGFEYKWRPGRTFAADLHFYLPYKKSLDPEGISYFDVDLRAIPNLSFGYEHYFGETWAIRTGFFTNLTAARSVPGNVSAIHDKVHMFGATGALILASPAGEVVLGGWVQGGQGYSRSVNPANTSREPRSNYFYGMVIASSYKF